MPVLTVRDVAKLYGSRLIFKNVSCELEAGEAMIVAGPNGAGKSTLLRVMAGLVRPTRGSATIALELEQVAYLGHATFIYPNLTARQNLVFWTGMYGLKRSAADIDEMLERVRLMRFAEERAGSFSRGMAQRLNLARVFLLRPRLVFLDEPGTGLDVDSLALLHREIAALRTAGTAIVWVSHQVEHDRHMVDKVLAIGAGRVAYDGPASDYRVEAVC